MWESLGRNWYISNLLNLLAIAQRNFMSCVQTIWFVLISYKQLGRLDGSYTFTFSLIQLLCSSFWRLIRTNNTNFWLHGSYIWKVEETKIIYKYWCILGEVLWESKIEHDKWVGSLRRRLTTFNLAAEKKVFMQRLKADGAASHADILG